MDQTLAYDLDIRQQLPRWEPESSAGRREVTPWIVFLFRGILPLLLVPEPSSRFNAVRSEEMLELASKYEYRIGRSNNEQPFLSSPSYSGNYSSRDYESILMSKVLWPTDVD